jgi:hypothetical protein
MSSHRLLAACVLLSALLVVPAGVRAGQHDHLGDIVISSNQEFDRAHGVTSGRGTMMNPYLFSHLDANSLTIENTSKAVKIVESSIGTLTLNFIGRSVEVVDNNINDLRVNENVPRTGQPTSGRFISNWFGNVGQIRHFDGRFAYNTIGNPEPPTCCTQLGGNRVVNFDGFNGAMFDHNFIYGSMDARLHGHHHSSMFGSGSHMHSGYDHDMVDHTIRYHEVKIFANKIYAPGASYALAYLDTNHAANDRTADSETNPELEKAHLHRTKVSITANTLTGSGLLVDVFNAEDDIHKGTPQGWLTIADNRITLERSQIPFQSSVTGIDIYQARYLNLRIARNSITGPGPEYQTSPVREWTFTGEGILLEWLDHANVMVDNNSITSRASGVRATQMTSTVLWTVRGLRTASVEQPVSYDNSVENEPRR